MVAIVPRMMTEQSVISFSVVGPAHVGRALSPKLAASLRDVSEGVEDIL